MAKQTVTTLVDDIDGSEAQHALEFAIDGVKYEIDLSEANHAEFLSGTEKFVKAARKASTGGRAGRRSRGDRAQSARSDSTAIRRWAQENGHQVSDRGRVARSVQEAFQQARERGEV